MRLTVKGPPVREVYRGLETQLKKGVTGAMRQATVELQDALREDTAAALGPQVGNTWKGVVYPQNGDSLEPAGFVRSRAPKLAEAFETGALIRPVNRRKLALPTPAALSIAKRAARKGPVEFSAATGIVLREIVVRGRRWLVGEATARQGVRTGGFSRVRPNTRTGRTTVFLFELVSKAKLKKRLHVAETAERIAATVPLRIEQHLGD